MQRLADEITGGGLSQIMKTPNFYQTTMRFGDDFAITVHLPTAMALSRGVDEVEEAVLRRIADWILLVSDQGDT
jgi:hypothetical protein